MHVGAQALDPALVAEKEALLAAGFQTWGKTDFMSFTSALKRFGRCVCMCVTRIVWMIVCAHFSVVFFERLLEYLCLRVVLCVCVRHDTAALAKAVGKPEDEVAKYVQVSVCVSCLCV